jgi:hypothetical protein
MRARRHVQKIKGLARLIGSDDRRDGAALVLDKHLKEELPGTGLGPSLRHHPASGGIRLSASP